MTVKKLENNNTRSIMTEEVKVLKQILDDTTHQMVGDEVFAKIQNIADLSASSEYVKLEKLVAQLTNDEMIVVSRYFSILPLLINISEDVDFAYEINYQNNMGKDYLGKLSLTVDMVSESDNAKEILENVNVVPVLTAHPTQVQRKTVLELTNHIHALLRK